MSDPMLDEDLIIQLLRVTPGTETLQAMQAGSIQALIDLYDRKATRQDFVHKAAACIGLYGQCQKLWLLENIRQVFISGELDEARFATAVKGLSELIGKQAEVVVDIVEQLKKCPGSKDAVH